MELNNPIGTLDRFTTKSATTNIFTIPEEESRACKFDNLLFESHRSLMKHVQEKHNMNFKQYVVAAYFENKNPTCLCGVNNCLIELLFKPLKTGPWFRDYTRNHFPRKPHSEETKNQIRKTLEDLYDGETPLKKKVREGVKKKIDQIHSKENVEKRLMKCAEFWGDDNRNQHEREKRSRNLLERWASNNGPCDPSKLMTNVKNDPIKFEKWRQKISIGASEQQQRDGTNFQYIFKCKLKNPFTKEWEYFGSSWEFLFARWCYSMNVVYSRSKITIPYLNYKGNWASYTPDFILPNTRELVETKGPIDDNTFIKRNAALKWCEENNYTYVFADYKKLIEIGLDLNKRTIKQRIKTILLNNRDTIIPINVKKYFGKDCYDFDNK